jgi:hypothetical protein
LEAKRFQGEALEPIEYCFFYNSLLKSLTFHSLEIPMTSEHKMWKESAAIKPELETDRLSAKAEQCSILSADLAKLLSDLSVDVKNALDQLQEVQSAVNRKKEELKALHDLDVSTVSLKQLIEDQRAEKDSLMRLMDSWRISWGEEKERLDREEKEYLDYLRLKRQREAEEHRRQWTAEQLKAQKNIEEDLRAAKQRCQQMQEAMEQDCLERKQILQGKELECSRLIQELERLMVRVNSHSKPEEDILVQENPEISILENASAEESGSIMFSLKDMAVLQGGKTESPNADDAEKRNSTTLKLSPKKFPKFTNAW